MIFAKSAIKKMKREIEVYSFYLFHKRKFPEFKEFAIASKGKYLLVPVPSLEFCNI